MMSTDGQFEELPGGEAGGAETEADRGAGSQEESRRIDDGHCPGSGEA